MTIALRLLQPVAAAHREKCGMLAQTQAKYTYAFRRQLLFADKRPAILGDISHTIFRSKRASY